MNARSASICHWAIVPAAGIGGRFSSHASSTASPKQYVKILGKSMLEHSVQALLDANRNLSVMISLAKDDVYWQREPIASHARVETVEGGEQRSDSVLAGLLALQGRADKNDFVLVHDAARPCVSVADINLLLTSTAEHAVGGLLASPVVDTLKRVDASGNVERTIDRDLVYRAQTPQVFRYGLLLQALEQAKRNNDTVTDESSALEKLGLAPLIVVGEASNIKVTYGSDLIYAEHCLRERE